MASKRMPHPGAGKGPALMIAVGVGPKKPGEQNPAEMPPKPDGMAATPNESDDDEDDDKIDPAKALVSHADQNCANCEHYDPSDGSCEKVSGTLSPDDRCYVFFEAMGPSGDSGAIGAGDEANMPAMAQ